MRSYRSRRNNDATSKLAGSLAESDDILDHLRHHTHRLLQDLAAPPFWPSLRLALRRALHGAKEKRMLSKCNKRMHMHTAGRTSREPALEQHTSLARHASKHQARRAHLVVFDIPLVRSLDLARDTDEALLELVLGRRVNHLGLHLSHIRAPIPFKTDSASHRRASHSATCKIHVVLPPPRTAGRLRLCTSCCMGANV